MKIKMLTILLILCVFVCGCSNERLSQPMEVIFFGEANKVLPEGELDPPPPHIAGRLWHDSAWMYDDGMILPPTKPDFEGYKSFPFKDGTDNFTIVVGDEIEIIQHKIGERYFRVLRNITRPEVDYSIFR